MNANPVVWFEIYVQDVARAKTFYESVLQLTLQQLPAPLPHLELWGFPKTDGNPGITGALVKIDGVPSGGNSTIVYFHCQDCEVEANRAAEFGGNVYRPKTAIGEYGYIALVHDTENNLIGLHSLQ